MLGRCDGAGIHGYHWRSVTLFGKAGLCPAADIGLTLRVADRFGACLEAEPSAGVSVRMQTAVRSGQCVT
jgi:hypothetical protein